MTFEGKHKIKDHWKKTIYWVEGQPYAGLPVIRIAPVEGEGKVKFVHWSLLLPFSDNVEASENEENQQIAPMWSTDAEPKGKGDVIHIQFVQTV